MKRKNAMILGVVWLMVMVSIAASTLTLIFSGESGNGRHWVSSAQYDMIERYSRLEAVRSELERGYVYEVDDETLVTGAIRGMMASLEDPYTFYYTEEEMEAHRRETGGAYVGVGLLVQTNAAGEIEIIRVYEGGPAEAAGVRAGDLLIAVDGAPVSGEDSRALNEAVRRIQGPEGSEVSLTLRRDGEAIEFGIARGDVSVSNVRHSILPGNVGYIGILQFGGEDVDEFEAALSALEAAQVEALVVDLRNNPGGLLTDVVSIADRLLPEGLIVYTEDRSGARQDYYSDAECCSLPLAVLINDMSASASEILAAAVQDHDRGALVGERSYGKGIVQTLIEFDEDGAGMQYTSACYYTPGGKSIHGTGVTPDILVEAAEGFSPDVEAPDLEADAQLRAAVDALLEVE